MLAIASKHPAFQLAQSLTKRTARDEQGMYLVETASFVTQALKSDVAVDAVYLVDGAPPLIAQLCEQRGIPTYHVTRGLLHKLVGTTYETDVTALAVVHKLVQSTDQLVTAGGLLLVGESIQDPRNVGVLIRTAEAVGCSAIALSADSAEPWCRAAVRSSTGSVVRLPVHLYNDAAELLTPLKDAGYSVVAASAHAPESALTSGMSVRPLAILVGNETNGLRPETAALATRYVHLPMRAGGPSSLNVTVAAGVLLYLALGGQSA